MLLHRCNMLPNIPNMLQWSESSRNLHWCHAKLLVPLFDSKVRTAVSGAWCAHSSSAGRTKLGPANRLIKRQKVDEPCILSIFLCLDYSVPCLCAALCNGNAGEEGLTSGSTVSRWPARCKSSIISASHMDRDIIYIYIYIYISNINVISILSQSWFERVESSSSFVIFVSLGFQANPASSKVKSHRGMRPHQGIDTFNILQRSGGGKNGFTKRKIYKSSKCVQHVRIWGSCWFQICSVWSFHKLSMALRKETVTRDK